ncbi:AEC family transporter [Microaerobacter geothermalis]|uniref:AEC family transporter n=1 Tax=Microaerobacter geothermalis TaxID=674972 RepID=UPI001F2C8F74|nr:AEC family transporter [Microaerobacter geothermalis]MCF6092829.1 AEC family transporter [Microaerobacter geothermalis]
MIFLNVILPVFLIFIAGYIAQKKMKMDIKSISTTALYLMLPALIFKTFYQAELDKTYVYIIAYGILLSYVIIWVVKLVSRLNKYSASEESGLILSTAFMNNGNYGAPIILFAFGDKAFSYAIAIMVFHTIIMSTTGIYYAARGRADLKKSLISVLKMPIVHALLLAIFWRWLQLPMPDNLLKTLTFVGDASVPTIMLVLGMQIAEIRLTHIRWNFISLGIFLRLILSPIIAWILVWYMPIELLLKKVMIVEAAMPAAAITTMYALQFDSEPEMVSSIALISTLLSTITVTILLIIII